MILTKFLMHKKILVFSFLLLFISPNAWGQSNVAALLGYPDLIVHNAKIVTVDDATFESEVGTIGQAMAVRGEEILAVGTNSEIRALAGPETQQMDLKGRTVLPSFIMTHEHPTDWAFAEPEALKHALPANNDFVVMRWLEGNAQQQLDQWETVLREAVAEAKPGQWVWLSFFWGTQYEFADELWRRFPQVVTQERVDQLAPNNPVRIKNSWPLMSVNNTRAQEELRKVHPEEALAGANRHYEPNVIFKDHVEVLAEILKAEMELWVAHGITTYGSSTYAYNNFQALTYLDRRGEMPARFAWGYTGPDFHIDTLRYTAGLVGTGSPYLWNVGAWDQAGGSCTTLNARRPEVKERERCSFAPGTPGRKVLEDIIRTGGRVATMHTQGDKDIGYLMDAIEQVSKEAGFTLEEIRAKRHAFDHASGAPHPDQIPRIKHLGMMVSMINTMLWENHRDYDTSARVRDYGIEFANLSVPRKSVTAAGIMNTFEIDRPLPHLVFTMIHKGMTRYNDRDGAVYAPGERTDRIVQLKALTVWGGYYVLRENLMGSLGPGKYADFIVLDRDYLTIPEDDIPNVKVLMTVVGGKTRHLMPSLAAENGMQPVGPVTWPTKPLENY
ncbi:MAG: amidohydrolase family protein [Acidobacteria bacterium]|nr:amidohydrolase family protein [Acidobacteriota bacterium]